MIGKNKSAEEDHYRSNVVCEELKSELNVTSRPVITIGKVVQKEVYGKGGSSTWPIWIVQPILEQHVNCMPPASISSNMLSGNTILKP